MERGRKPVDRDKGVAVRAQAIDTLKGDRDDSERVVLGFFWEQRKQ